MAYDLLIKNGRIVDGSGMPSFMGDVAVKDGKIVELGKLSGPAGQTGVPALVPARGRPPCRPARPRARSAGTDAAAVLGTRTGRTDRRAAAGHPVRP